METIITSSDKIKVQGQKYNYVKLFGFVLNTIYVVTGVTILNMNLTRMENTILWRQWMKENCGFESDLKFLSPIREVTKKFKSKELGDIKLLIIIFSMWQ